MNQYEYLNMSDADRSRYDAQQQMSQQQMVNMGMNAMCSRSMLDINASTETAYPVKNGNSMNKKLEAAKKSPKDRKSNV